MRPQEGSPCLKGMAQQSACIVGGRGKGSGLPAGRAPLSILSSPT